jgi:hypothetical protein
MPTVLQFRRGTTVQNDAFTGSVGEVSIDTDLDTLVVHDGTTAGGHTLVTDTATQTLTNKTLTSPNITSLSLGGVAITATGTELNVLDGIPGTLTATELGYVDGVTSAIQTQIDAKAPLASPTLTGTPAAPTAAVNTNTTQVATTAYVVAQIADDAPTKTGTGASGTWGISISGTAALATSVTATANNEANETVYLTFVDAATGTQGIETDTNLTYNPSTNVLSTTATSAQYADLAEKYKMDQTYDPGTVVVVGGEQEATESTTANDHKVLGIISTAPAYLMNNDIEGQDVALIGRVPCKVVGDIQRGDLLVTSDVSGHAKAWNPEDHLPGTIIGKSLEVHEGQDPGIIEVAVGKV